MNIIDKILYEKWSLWIRIIVIPIRISVLFLYIFTLCLPIMMVNDDLSGDIAEWIVEIGNK